MKDVSLIYANEQITESTEVMKILNKMTVSDFSLSDHNVFFFASPKEKHRLLFFNLKTGLDNGCSALYITSGEDIEQVRVEMENFGLRDDNPAKLKIVTSHQFYTPDGEFHADRVVGQYRSLIDKSVDKGFEGLYVSADASDTFDYLMRKDMVEVWLKCENAFGRTFRFPMEAICAYRKDQMKSNSQTLLQLIQAHKNTVTAKKLKFVDNQKICSDAIGEELENLLSVEAAGIVLGSAERRFKIPRNQIPDKLEDFNKLLESILGSGGTIIKKKILENLHGKIELELDDQ